MLNLLTLNTNSTVEVLSNGGSTKVALDNKTIDRFMMLRLDEPDAKDEVNELLLKLNLKIVKVDTNE